MFQKSEHSNSSGQCKIRSANTGIWSLLVRLLRGIRKRLGRANRENMRMTVLKNLAHLASVCWLLLAQAALAGTLTAELSSTSMAINESVQLHVNLEGDLDGDLDIPAVDGLVMKQVGRSTQMNL